MLLSRFVAGMLSVELMVLGAGVASAQDYPNKPIRIVTSGAGGGGDFVTRLISPGLAASLGQPVVVDNRPGIIPAQFVSKAPPDGYTLQVAGGAVWIIPLLRETPYDMMRDFSAISLLVREIFIVVVHPSVPVKSVRELIALAKARPGELNFASPGPGTTQHLGLELFKSMTGVNIVHIPHKGGAAAITALMSGEMQALIYDWGVVAPHLKSGKLRALAVASATPSTLVPGLPTVAASGLPGYDVAGLTGIWAPAKTPGAIINRLNQEIVRVINLPDVNERFLNAGLEAVGGSPEQFAATLKSEIAKWGKVIKDGGIKVD